MRISQLNHVALHVKDLDASIRFYGQVLGLKPCPRPGFNFAGAWFQIAPESGNSPQQELHLIGRSPETDMPPRERHFAMLVESIQEAERDLRDKGVEFSGPNGRPDGAMQIFLRDPDGHVIELCSRLPV
jgi:catechol 2,3-dioxygenase-like lactoylglutathione lyase family enzyme